MGMNEMPLATDEMIVSAGGRPQPVSHTASMDTKANLRQMPKLREERRETRRTAQMPVTSNPIILILQPDIPRHVAREPRSRSPGGDPKPYLCPHGHASHTRVEFRGQRAGGSVAEQRVQRRLAAILVADVAGYPRHTNGTTGSGATGPCLHSRRDRIRTAASSRPSHRSSLIGLALRASLAV